MFNNKRLTLSFISIGSLIAIAILLIALFENYKSTERGLKKLSESKIQLFEEAIEKNLLLKTSIIETITKNLSSFVSYSHPTKEALKNITFKEISEHTYISGICIFNMDKIDETTVKTSEIYYYRTNDSISFTDLVLAEDTMADWFVLPKINKTGVWIEPYNYILGNENEKANMISYSVPFYKSDSVFSGVIAVDIFLDYITNSMNTPSVLKNGTVLVLSRQKNVISSSIRKIQTISLDSVSAIYNQPVFEELKKRLDTKRNGYFYADSIFGSANVAVSYKFIENDNILCLILPYSEIHSDLITFKNWQFFKAGLGVVIILMLAISIYYFVTHRLVKYYNKELEQKVEFQTHELREKNEELLAIDEELRQQNEELEVLNDDITLQKEIIEIAHRDIKSSITYAKTIQDALLTSKELIQSFIPEYFLFFRPKAVVSGDFYYINKLDNYLIIAIADCTGHGVPGGFVSVLGITYLHEAVKKVGTMNAGEILDLLRDRFKRTYRRFGTENINGLNISLCIINTTSNILQYAGAFQPIIIIRNNEIIVHQATKNPIGFFYKEIHFENNEILLHDNDMLYFYTDGYVDQFGGPLHKKFTSKRFKELLLQIHRLSVNEQHKIVENTLDNWQTTTEQIDDITVFAMRWKSLSI